MFDRQTKAQLAPAPEHIFGRNSPFPAHQVAHLGLTQSGSKIPSKIRKCLRVPENFERESPVLPLKPKGRSVIKKRIALLQGTIALFRMLWIAQPELQRVR